MGGGCFWCTEAVFSELRGVAEVLPGYAGGRTEAPTYEQVCDGDTGHAEVVQVRFDPKVLPFRELLQVFFTTHDPTTPNRQGADVGTQYRSIILTHSAEQRETARAAIREAEAIWGTKVVTEVVDFTRFFPAEEYHRQYFRRNPSAGYCRAVIAPKVAKFRKTYSDRLRSAPPQ